MRGEYREHHKRGHLNYNSAGCGAFPSCSSLSHPKSFSQITLLLLLCDIFGVCFVDFYYSNMHSLFASPHAQKNNIESTENLLFSLTLSRRCGPQSIKSQRAQTHYIVLKNKRVIFFMCPVWILLRVEKWSVLFQGCSFVGALNGKCFVGRCNGFEAWKYFALRCWTNFTFKNKFFQCTVISLPYKKFQKAP